MSFIQSVRFNKKYFTYNQACNWLKKYKIKPIKPVDETKNWYRFRIEEPDYKNYYYRTKVVEKGKLHFIIGFRRKRGRKRKR